MSGEIFKALVMNPVSEDETEFYNPGYLFIYDGKLVSLSKEDPTPHFPKAKTINLEDKVILPGLVDTHLHLPQFPFLGIGDGELMEWIEKYAAPEEAKFKNPEYARKVAQKFFDELVANGTTTASIYTTIHEKTTNIAFEVAAENGGRYDIGKVMMDQNSKLNRETTKESIDASLRLFEKWNNYDNGRLRYRFTPRYAPTCSEELMNWVGEFVKKNDAHAQTHLSENGTEIKMVQEIFGEDISYTSVYDSFGLLGPNIIMAHCIHLSKDEIKRLADTGTKVAHCPYSNRFLRSGVMLYRQLKGPGLDIGLGTDIAGGPSISMLNQMGEAVLASYDATNIHKDANLIINPTEALYLATLGGAKVLGLEGTIGSFTPKKEADFIVINPLLSDPMKGESEYNSPKEILSRLCFNAGKESVERVYVRGKRIHPK